MFLQANSRHLSLIEQDKTASPPSGGPFVVIIIWLSIIIRSVIIIRGSIIRLNKKRAEKVFPSRPRVS